MNPTRSSSVLWSIAILAALSACGPATPAEDHQQATAAPGEAEHEQADHDAMTLKLIMQGLETDMAAGAHGLWIADRQAVGVAAGRIADHPHVTPEQMSVIQSTLGDEFADFVRYDQAVHGAAVALAEAAMDDTADLAAGYLRIQEGCLACHAVFRDRISLALKSGGG